MANDPIEECPSCERLGVFTGPEPYVCAVCGYVLTPGSVEEPDEEEED